MDNANLITAALRSAATRPWALEESHAPAVSALIHDAVAGLPVTEARLSAAIGAAGPGRARHTGSTAVIPIHGLILYDLHFPPFATSARKIASEIRALAADPAVTRIVLDISSPGGTVHGVQEAALEIYRARARKPIIATINPYAGSAAFWLASQASEIAITPSGDVGSIGVFMIHVDQSRALEAAGLNVTLIKSKSSPNKAAGASFLPLDPAARDRFQADVDAVAATFIRDVARGRGVSPATVRANFGGGFMLMAADAKRAGLVDRIATFEMVLAGRLTPSRSARRAGPSNSLGNSPEAERSGRRRRLAILGKS